MHKEFLNNRIFSGVYSKIYLCFFTVNAFELLINLFLHLCQNFYLNSLLTVLKVALFRH